MPVFSSSLLLPYAYVAAKVIDSTMTGCIAVDTQSGRDDVSTSRFKIRCVNFAVYKAAPAQAGLILLYWPRKCLWKLASLPQVLAKILNQQKYFRAFQVNSPWGSAQLSLSPSTSCISYRPASRPISQTAARMAPPAKVIRLEALWVISILSPSPANNTV
jgi:hypothetical protein